jgi:hypothetical protein
VGAVADQHSTAVDRLTLAVDVSPNRSTAAVSLSGSPPDGLWHVELDEHRKGADWVPGWIEQRAAKNKLHAVVVDEMSGLVESAGTGTTSRAPTSRSRWPRLRAGTWRRRARRTSTR